MPNWSLLLGSYFPMHLALVILWQHKSIKMPDSLRSYLDVQSHTLVQYPLQLCICRSVDNVSSYITSIVYHIDAVLIVFVPFLMDHS